MNPLQQIADNLAALNSDVPEVADAVIKLTNMAAHPSRGVVDDGMARIGDLIRTQNNRITASPIFAVEQKRWIGGIDPDYGGERVWVHDGEEVADEDEIAKLDAQYAESYSEPKGYTLTGKVHVWEFVTACFTEQGCKDYLATNGHNLREPRIYVHSGFRNAEWQTIRAALQAAALPAAPTRNMEQVRSEAFNLADTVIEWIESGNVQAARDAIRDSLVAHAAPPAVPDTWQERLRAEYAELDERFTKLCAFLESERFASLHEDDRRILMAQGNGMRAYLNALTFRVDQLDYAATPAHDQPEGSDND